jgi:hypothetical protein
VNPPQRLTAAIHQPELDVERDVYGSRPIAAAELGKCSGSCLLIKDQPGDVLQVRALLGGSAIHDGWQLHGDQGTRFCDQH